MRKRSECYVLLFAPSQDNKSQSARNRGFAARRFARGALDGAAADGRYRGLRVGDRGSRKGSAGCLFWGLARVVSMFLGNPFGVSLREIFGHFGGAYVIRDKLL